MKVIRSIAAMQRTAISLRKQGKTIALVPTMGALHEGHLSLVEKARKSADVTVVSIFVNPTQFAPHEDLGKYPRNFPKDSRLLKDVGADIVFFPTAAEIYPAGFDTYVIPEKISTKLEGKFRPTHFRGVATVVLKLFNLVLPDVAIFGKKDLQQSIVIKQMVRDLNIPVKVIVAPTVRDHDGLALSSRNVYLSAEGRKRALVISSSLFEAGKMIRDGEKSASKIRNYITRRLVSIAKAEVDYVSVADETSLDELQKIVRQVAISLACKIDGVRLIDNITLKVK